MKIRTLIILTALFSALSISCSDKIDDNQSTPAVSFSEDDLIYDVKVNERLTIEPTITNAIDGHFEWSYKGEVVSRESSLEFSSDKAGQHILTFTINAANGSVEREICINVLALTPPEVSFSLTDGVIRSIVGRDTEITPNLKYCGSESRYQWYIDGEKAGNTKSIIVNKDEIGDYTISLDVENSDGSTRAEATLRICEVPALAFDFDQESYNVALGSSIVLSPTVSYGDASTRYSWNVSGSSQSSSTKYLTFIPEAVGEYVITITGSGSENNATATTLVKCVEAIDHQRGITAESSNEVKCYEFTAAPGQFVNAGYTATTPDEAADYAEGYFNKSGSFVSLGNWGGYAIVGFDHSVLNVEGKRDLWVGGNAFASSNEPAAVWVMQDVNGDGLPNDIWYEVKGSEYGLPTTIQDYAITYYRAEAGENVEWRDNSGNSGTIDANSFHTQCYYPNWITADSYTISGTRIKARSTDQPSSGDGNWSNAPFEWGYADNSGSDYIDAGTEIELDNAINRDGTPANLKYIDFVKVQSAVNAKAGWLGEVSPEITGFKNLNL